MTPEEQTLADALIAARRSGPLLPTATTTPPKDMAAVYRIQSAIAAATGGPGGFKAGAPAADAPATFAPIPAHLIRQSGAVLPAAESRLCGVELEVGFLLQAAPPAPDDPAFDKAFTENLAMVAAIEIVESCLDDHVGAPPLLKLADSLANGGLVLGTPVQHWSGIERDRPTARFVIGGNVVWDGPAQVPGGDALATVLHFARAVGGHCGGLKPGDAIITGALTGLLYAEPGDAVRGEIDGLGAVSARFE